TRLRRFLLLAEEEEAAARLADLVAAVRIEPVIARGAPGIVLDPAPARLVVQFGPNPLLREPGPGVAVPDAAAVAGGRVELHRLLPPSRGGRPPPLAPGTVPILPTSSLRRLRYRPCLNYATANGMPPQTR